MDAVSIMMMILPILTLIVHELGFHPAWFVVIFLINGDIGRLTPPYGLPLFTMERIAPDYSIQEIIKAQVPFISLDLLSMALIIVFPSIALWILSVMR